MYNRKNILIECEELQRIGTEHFFILDATVLLEKPAFDGDYRVQSGLACWQKKHIPHSLHIDMYHDFSNPDVSYSFAVPEPQVAQHFLRQLGLSQDSDIVVYDAKDGIWASRLWWVLSSLGIKSRILNGGLTAWENAGYPVQQQIHASTLAQSGDITVTALDGYWCDLQEVKQRAQHQSSGLVCALGPEQFTGQGITRYARRGAIPNSVNVPARLFIGADNQFISDHEIKNTIQQLSWHEDLDVLYCGGGISACVLAVAIRLISNQPLSIYDGSLQEWAQISDLPLVTGTP